MAITEKVILALPRSLVHFSFVDLFFFFLLVQNIVAYFPSHTNLLLYKEYNRRHLDRLLELSLEMHVNFATWNFFICPNILRNKKSVNMCSTAARLFPVAIFVILLTCVIITLL